MSSRRSRITCQLCIARHLDDSLRAQGQWQVRKVNLALTRALRRAYSSFVFALQLITLALPHLHRPLRSVTCLERTPLLSILPLPPLALSLLTQVAKDGLGSPESRRRQPGALRASLLPTSRTVVAERFGADRSNSSRRRRRRVSPFEPLTASSPRSALHPSCQVPLETDPPPSSQNSPSNRSPNGWDATKSGSQRSSMARRSRRMRRSTS